MTEQYQDWTACQMFGHAFDEDGHCPCGEQREEDNTNGK